MSIRNLADEKMNEAQPRLLSDDEIAREAERVSAQVMAQMSQQMEQIPNYHIDQGNIILIFLLWTMIDVNYEF